jgi:hypothetical protein
MDLDDLIDRYAQPKPEPGPAKSSDGQDTRTYLVVGKDAELLREILEELARHKLLIWRQDP